MKRYAVKPLVGVRCAGNETCYGPLPGESVPAFLTDENGECPNCGAVHLTVHEKETAVKGGLDANGTNNAGN